MIIIRPDKFPEILCHECFSPISIDWVDASTIADAAKGVPVYLPGSMRCSAIRYHDVRPAMRKFQEVYSEYKEEL